MSGWGWGWGGLTDAGLRVAGATFLNRSLTHSVFRLAASTAHLHSSAALLAADGPAAPDTPVLCRKQTARHEVTAVPSNDATLVHKNVYKRRTQAFRK